MNVMLYVGAARDALTAALPYISTAVYRVGIIVKPGEAGVSNRWTIHIDEDWVQEGTNTLYLPSLIGAGVLALVLDMEGRCGDRIVPLWELAASLSINSVLHEAGIIMPDDVLLPKAFQLKPVQSAETYYDQLLERLPEIPQSKPQKGQGQSGTGVSGEKGDQEPEPADGDGEGQGEDGEGEGGGQAPGEGGDMADSVLGSGAKSAVADVVRSAVAEAAKNWAAKGRGKLPGEFKTFIDVQLTPSKVDWRHELEAWAGTSRSAHDIGAGIRSYRRPSRRQTDWSSGSPVFPSTWKPRSKLGFVLDTSGSMSEPEIINCLVQAADIMTSGGVYEIRIVVCDAKVHLDMVLDSPHDIVTHFEAIKGRGGTDMRVGVNHLADDDTLAGIIIATDGDTPWPAEEDTELPILALLTRPSSNWNKPPDHINTIVIDDAYDKD